MHHCKSISFRKDKKCDTYSRLLGLHYHTVEADLIKKNEVKNVDRKWDALIKGANIPFIIINNK